MKIHTPQQLEDWSASVINNPLTSKHLIRALKGRIATHQHWSSTIAKVPKPSTSLVDKVKKIIKHKISGYDDKVMTWGYELVKVALTDLAANYTYGLKTFANQGYSQDDAKSLAIRYALDKTRTDLLAEGGSALVGKLIQALGFKKMGRFVEEILDNGTKLWLITGGFTGDSELTPSPIVEDDYSGGTGVEAETYDVDVDKPETPGGGLYASRNGDSTAPPIPFGNNPPVASGRRAPRRTPTGIFRR